MPRCSRCKKWYITVGKKSLPVIGTAVSVRINAGSQWQITVNAKSLPVVGTDVCNQWRVIVGRKYIAIVGGSTQSSFGWTIPASVYSLGVSNEGVAATYDLAQYATIPAGTTAVWALQNPVSGITLNSAGVLFKAANVTQTALLSVVVSLSQAVPGYAETSRTFTLSVVASNTAPFFTSAPSAITLSRGGTYNFGQYASDPDLESLTFSLVSSPSNYSINPATGVVTLSNSTPVFTVIPSSPSYLPSTGGTLQFTAVDPDGDTVTYQLPQTRTGITHNSTTGLVTVTSLAAGTNGDITVRATDGSLYKDAVVTVTVG